MFICEDPAFSGTDEHTRCIVGAGIEEAAFGFEAIASCTSAFLLIVLEGLGHGGMDDIANVGFIDAHAKGYRRHDDIHIFVDKGILAFFPCIVGHAGVIRRNTITLSGQSLSHYIDVGAPDAVNDSGLSRVAIQPQVSGDIPSYMICWVWTSVDIEGPEKCADPNTLGFYTTDTANKIRSSRMDRIPIIISITVTCWTINKLVAYN
jgi:hypothetical protein